jgi:hypothetical protein
MCLNFQSKLPLAPGHRRNASPGRRRPRRPRRPSPRARRRRRTPNRPPRPNSRRRGRDRVSPTSRSKVQKTLFSNVRHYFEGSVTFGRKPFGRQTFRPLTKLRKRHSDKLAKCRSADCFLAACRGAMWRLYGEGDTVPESLR